MRVTQSLCANHLGFMFKNHWRVQGKRVASETGSKEALLAQGKHVVDALDVIKPVRTFTKIDVQVFPPPAAAKDSTHPLWKSRSSYMYEDSNVLLQGIAQAQLLTKTIEIKETPTSISAILEQTKIPTSIEKSMYQSTIESCLYDAEQEKLAIVKDPLRPAFTFPRVYGITDQRKNRLLTSKLLHHCELLSGAEKSTQRKIASNALFVVPYKRNGDSIQLQLHADEFVASKQPLPPLEHSDSFQSMNLPVLHPIKHTITMPLNNIYDSEDSYPISAKTKFNHPHTVIAYFSPQDVKNLHGTPVTSNQFESRSLMKTFAATVARARAVYGADVKELPQPITVQCVHTDSKTFHFSIFQLNTMDFDCDTGLKNFWFNIASMDLYTECLYKNGKPIIGGYNKDVFKYMFAFYQNN